MRIGGIGNIGILPVRSGQFARCLRALSLPFVISSGVQLAGRTDPSLYSRDFSCELPQKRRSFAQTSGFGMSNKIIASRSIETESEPVIFPDHKRYRGAID